MAYHLTHAKSYDIALKRKLRHVDGGLRFLATKRYVMEDKVEDIVVIEKGQHFRITGTRDSNGFVVTIEGANRTLTTHLLTAEVGVRLF